MEWHAGAQTGGSVAVAAVGARPPSRRSQLFAFSIARYTAGTTTSDSSVELMTPPITAMAMGARNSLPSPREMAVGSMPRIMAALVIKMGRSRSGPASRMA